MRLTAKERRTLKSLLTKGVGMVRVFKKARVLLLMDEGLSAPKAAMMAGVVANTARNVARRYKSAGIEHAIHDLPRPGSERLLDVHQEAAVIAMVCSKPPEGFARWSISLIAKKAILRGISDSVSEDTIGRILKRHELKPWREKMWCVAKIDDADLDKMEDVLATYEKSLNPSEPVVCVDETSIQLLGNVSSTSRMARCGKPRRKDYEYKRKGMVNAFCAIEPKRGRHFIKITKDRKADQFAEMLRDIGRAYPAARKIHLVMDNLSTHTKNSLVNTLG